MATGSSNLMLAQVLSATCTAMFLNQPHASLSTAGSIGPVVVFIATPEEEVPNMADDRQLREMTRDPKYRKVLITDGKSELGQAMVREIAQQEPTYLGGPR